MPISFLSTAAVVGRAACASAICILALALARPAFAETPISGANPSRSDARVPAVTYRSVLDGYTSQRPVAPAPWREQNDRVTPAQKR